MVRPVLHCSEPPRTAKITLPQMPIMPHSETMIMDENLIMDSESLDNFPESGAINQADICLPLKIMFLLYSTEH